MRDEAGEASLYLQMLSGRVRFGVSGRCCKVEEIVCRIGTEEKVWSDGIKEFAKQSLNSVGVIP
jgi:hypothetical protein